LAKQLRGKTMFAIGHFALGYLTGNGSSRLTKTKVNLPLLLVASVLPDIDLLLQYVDRGLFMHRGPTHSIITITLFMIPLLVIYRKQALPYFVAVLSHPLIGDLPTGGIELLWPASQHWFGGSIIPMSSSIEVSAELVLFAVATSLMFWYGDLKRLLKPATQNMYLIVAAAAVLVPMLESGRGLEASLPLLLVPSSVFWLILFVYSILNNLHLRGANGKRVDNG
jgi:membrane-bound metal-dependent hydrolase YbcI (DUF457 family)